MKSRERFSRRAFLKASGASPLLLPLLEPELARAGCLTNAPRRAVFVIWSDGALPGNSRAQWPTGPSETNFTLPTGLASLEPHRNDLLFIDRLNYQLIADTPSLDGKPINGHFLHQGLLTAKRYLPCKGDAYGWEPIPTGPSIDQHIGQDLASRGFRGLPGLSNGVLYTGVRCLFPDYAVWKAAGSPVAPQSEPSRVFSTLFTGQAGVAPDPAIERLQRARKSVLDTVGRDIERFSRRLGTDDRARVQRHLDSVRSIEKDLSAVREMTACPVPALDASLPGIGPNGKNQQIINGQANYGDPEEDGRIPALLKLHIDLVVAALATDVVRVVVLELNDGADWWSLPWLGLSDNLHYIAHGQTPNGDADKLKADQWIYSQWAYLVGQLKNEKEGGKSVLDSSVVAFLNDMSAGHVCSDIPAVMAGSCGGYFKTGRNVTNKAPGQFQNPLLVSIANAMGVPLTSFGDPEYNSGEMPGLRS